MSAARSFHSAPAKSPNIITTTPMVGIDPLRSTTSTGQRLDRG